MKRVWLRAAALALVVVGAVAGLTVYFSSETIPRCLVSGVGTWRPPTDGRTHHYEVVILDRLDVCAPSGVRRVGADFSAEKISETFRLLVKISMKAIDRFIASVDIRLNQESRSPLG